MKFTATDSSGQVIASREFPAGTKSVNIGRDDSNDVVLGDVTVSPFHAIIEDGRRGYVVRDSGSINGVYVGKKKVPDRGAAVRTGDAVTLGGCTLSVDLLEPSLEFRRRTLMARVAVLLFTVLVVLLAIRYGPKEFRELSGWVKRELGHEKALAPPAPAPPKVSEERTSRLEDLSRARSLFKEGERSYYLGDREGAAQLISEAVFLDPDNARAQDILVTIRREAFENLFPLARQHVADRNYGAAETVVAEMGEVGYNEPRLIELRAILKGQHRFEEAKDLYRKGRVREAYSILASSRIYDEGERQQWLREMEGDLAFEKRYEKALRLLDTSRPEEALAVLSSLEGVSGFRVLNLPRVKEAAQMLITFRKALEDHDFLTAVRDGRRLESLIDAGVTPLLAETVDLEMRMLKNELQKDPRYSSREEIRVHEEAGREAGEKGDLVAAYRLYHLAMEESAVRAFIDGDADAAQRAETLRQKVGDFVREEYRKGYILEETGKRKEASRHYMMVVELAESGSDYYRKAAERLAAWDLSPPKEP